MYKVRKNETSNGMKLFENRALSRILILLIPSGNYMYHPL
jgi:hypothetical protein